MDLGGRIPGDIGKRVVRLLCSPCLPLHNTHVLGASSVTERANDDCARYGRLTKRGDGLSSNATTSLLTSTTTTYHIRTMNPLSAPPPYALEPPPPPGYTASITTTLPPPSGSTPRAQTFLGLAKSKFRKYVNKIVRNVFGANRV
ncbi:hypothetical protein B0H10DRAFT_2428938 [Mycena sp. CBHHK59/15]|nr:hypothetical protein B0H10DRAFT_2428938 [Mycena sp. CBHHK59/15]